MKSPLSNLFGIPQAVAKVGEHVEGRKFKSLKEVLGRRVPTDRWSLFKSEVRSRRVPTDRFLGFLGFLGSFKSVKIYRGWHVIHGFISAIFLGMIRRRICLVRDILGFLSVIWFGLRELVVVRFFGTKAA